MKMPRRSLASLVLGAGAFVNESITRSEARNDGRILLDAVKVITLHDAKDTAGRRSAPVPQLVCRGGCQEWAPEVVQCYNMGSDGTDAAWKCEANMPDDYSFSSVEVSCEGYDYPDDPYILKDSCQLIYTLRAPRGNGGGRGGVGADGWGSSARSWEDGNNPTWDGRPAGRKRGRGEVGTGRDFGSRLMTWAVLGVVGYVLYNTFLRAAETPSGGGPSPPPPTSGGGGGGWGGGGGGGGGGGDNWRGGGTDNSAGGPPSKGAAAAGTAPAASAPAQGEGMYPWLAGGGIGAALGYMLRPRHRRHAPARGGMAWNQGYGTGTLGGRGGGGGRAYQRRGSGGGGGGGGRGGGMQAGYGGTSRR
ncbi:unnamed protein product [Ectocarpus sp. 13 AM-2016]